VGVGFLAGESYAAVARYLGWASLGIVAGLLALALVVRAVRRRQVGAPAGRGAPAGAMIGQGAADVGDRGHAR
ncbi:MAG: hypothetical protein ACRD0J_00230, partial [Acidimicrobiales bacterium]